MVSGYLKECIGDILMEFNLRKLSGENVNKSIANANKSVNKCKRGAENMKSEGSSLQIKDETSTSGNDEKFARQIEIAMRRGKMECNYRAHMENMFVKKRLDIVSMITMFKVFFTVSTGSYNSSALSASTKELMLLNSTARNILMRIFGFK